MKLSDDIRPGETVMLCLAGNLCDPEVAYEFVEQGDMVRKINVNYLAEESSGNVDAIAEELGQFIKFHEKTKFILNGYSAGGVIALGTAAKYPEAVAGLILSNTGPCSIGHGNPHFADELKEHFDDEAYIRNFLNSCFAKEVPSTVSDRLWQFTRTVSADAGYMVSKTLREVDYREQLKNYHHPVLIIHGLLDTRRKMNSVEMMKECMPQAEVVLLETGHTPMREDPLGYNEALKSLIQKL